MKLEVFVLTDDAGETAEVTARDEKQASRIWEHTHPGRKAVSVRRAGGC